jgi:hypothetical protein
VLIIRSRFIRPMRRLTILSMLLKAIVFMFPWFVPYHSSYAPLRPQVTVLNKIDAISIQELDLLYKIPNSVPISSKEWLNIDELLEMMWDKLDLVRV